MAQIKLTHAADRISETYDALLFGSDLEGGHEGIGDDNCPIATQSALQALAMLDAAHRAMLVAAHLQEIHGGT